MAVDDEQITLTIDIWYTGDYKKDIQTIREACKDLVENAKELLDGRYRWK